jgi:membrane associated rhomboid family serine protease
VAVFLVFGIFWVVIKLSGLDDANAAYIIETVTGWLRFPVSLQAYLIKPWTIITYQFLHIELFHLLFNMLVLLVAGRIFREFLGDKKLLSVYIMGGICGAVMFMAAYQVFPMFEAVRTNGSILGASASILALLAAAGTLVPDYTLHLILIGPVRLKYVVIVLLVLDLLSLAGQNAGGHFAHLGGAIWGFGYIKALQNGRDLGKWLTSTIDWIKGLFRKKPAVRVRYYSNQPVTPKSEPSGVSQEEIDKILDKIAKSGYDSLNQKEKDTLFKASKSG